MWVELPHDGKEFVPVNRLGEGEDTLILDFWKNRRCHMQQCGILDVHEVL